MTPTGAGGPVVVETICTRPSGGAVTRQSLVVKQDGKTLTVVMLRSRENNINEIVDESDLLR